MKALRVSPKSSPKEVLNSQGSLGTYKANIQLPPYNFVRLWVYFKQAYLSFSWIQRHDHMLLKMWMFYFLSNIFYSYFNINIFSIVFEPHY